MSRAGRIRAVLFDLDGTLADSLADIGGAVNRVLVELGFPTHPVASYARFVGDGAEKLIERALPEDQVALRPEALARYRQVYYEQMFDQTRLFDGIPALLDALAEDGYRLAVLSNKPDGQTRAMCEKLLARWHFSAVFGERHGVPRKPDPQGALEIAQRLELAPAACAFVGDTPIDMRTSVAAGMFGIGVTWGFRPREELIAAGGKVVAERPGEILAALRQQEG